MVSETEIYTLTLFSLKALSYSMSNVLKALFFASILVSSGSILPISLAQNATLILSPLKQLKNGVSLHDVKCKEGFTLIIKTSDNSPACVTPQTAQRLIERGWSTMSSLTQSQQFITKDEALRVIREKYNKTNAATPSDIYLAYMKYNGTINGNYQFVLQTQEQLNTSRHEDQVIVFVSPIQKYFSDKTIDRYVWIVIFPQPGGPINLEYLIDAKTKELVAVYNTCPACA